MSKFTPAQQEAIDTDAKNILVSAAAGSGKTAVLTERIVRHVSSGRVNIDNLLVVTFTESASAEMRERIGKRLHELGRIDQIARLPMANISTIHAFCKKLVQEHFQLVDIDPAFRVGDEAELDIIRRAVVEELFEEEYGNKSFVDLANVYGGKTLDGKLDILVRKIYDFMESDPFPAVAAGRYAKYFDAQDIDSTKWADVVRDELSLGLEGALEGMRQALAICNLPAGPEKYIDKLEDEKLFLQNLLRKTAKGTGFAEMYEAFTYIDWGRLPRITEKDEVDPELKERVQSIRDSAVKKRINGLVKDAFFATPGKMQADLSALAPRVAALMDLTVKFSAKFAEEKRARNLLDFTDLEHFAIRILYPNGPDDMTPVETYKFFEVLIDEYQDSNAVQDLILSAVADRRFMVGDVKQSIYRFRRANPGLFLDKYQKYANQPVGKSDQLKFNKNMRIDLSHNFRSRPEVLYAVNFFFSQLMCLRVGEVEYDRNAALHPGHEEYPPLPDGCTPQMWVEILDQSDEYEPDENGEEDEADDETPDNVVAETRVIAKSILELLDTPRQVWDSDMEAFRPCRPGDIAVLVRSLSSMAGTIIEELKNHGIDAVADMNSGFLDQLEVKTALAFLKVVDNPRQDIDLITVLRSPVYGVTDDELLEITLTPVDEHSGDVMFYDHLMAAVPTEKTKKFMHDLQKWRDAALHMSVSRLLGLIYDQTRYPAIVLSMPGGAIRQANLRLLMERAMEFEETSLRGLFHFVHYIVRLYDADTKTGGAIAEPTEDPSGRVRLMTIHKSKGLEFPVVICAFLGKMFNTDDTRQPVILHPEFGVGPYYVDTELRTRSNTLARFSLGRLTARESLSEELRCLYVALTRAKELLILTGRSKNLDKAVQKWANHINTADTNLPAYYRSGVKTYLDWIMPCLLRHRSAGEFVSEPGTSLRLWEHPAEFKVRRHRYSSLELYRNESAAVIASPVKQSRSTDPSIFTGLPRRYAPRNDGDGTACNDGPETAVLTPYTSGQTPLPSKLSISEIKRLYDITPDSTIPQEYAISFDPPQFIRANSDPTPAQIGTALHAVTEHLDYNIHSTPGAIDGLILDLAEKNLLTPEEVAFIDRSKILELINSPLAARIRRSPNVYRETPFVMAMPAAELYPHADPEETILVHGIIDCYFEEDGEIVLLDYKSDAQPMRHKTQMEIYKKAIANATAKNVKEVLIYSFALGKAMALTDSSN